MARKVHSWANVEPGPDTNFEPDPDATPIEPFSVPDPGSVPTAEDLGTYIPEIFIEPEIYSPSTEPYNPPQSEFSEEQELVDPSPETPPSEETIEEV